MKKLSARLLTLGIIIFASTVFAKEITLYDSEGDAAAYIDTDHDLTIYLWEGKHVAYLADDSVWGFNGKHLGWFESGIIGYHKGYAVGCVKGAVSMNYNLEPLKGLKELRPLKSLKELKLLNPLKMNRWAPLPLSLFFGLENKIMAPNKRLQRTRNPLRGFLAAGRIVRPKGVIYD
ncbi:MAG: hypothetical protein FJ106_02125 [Deltaproteobacteria bacterium]|nr:hypothetical protein [Deltaproteobacteria bacterium]